MNDQIVELTGPGLQIIMYSPFAVGEMEEDGDYAARLPDGRDLVDHMNECRVVAIGTRWPQRHYWLHFSSSMDHAVIARASDHALLGVEVREQQLCIRGGDDLFKWKTRCPDEQLVTIEDGFYMVTAMMLPVEGDGAVRIYFHFAPAPAAPEFGYASVPELFCEAPVW
ncbi:MAG: hypothetical protein RIF41_34145 [Polyangiaceae bacterium]